MCLLVGAVQAAQFVVNDYGPDTQVAKTLAVIGWNIALVFGAPVAAFGASAAILILRFKLLPTWLGALAVLVLLSGLLIPWGAVAVLAPWVLLTSIVLLVEASKRPTAANALRRSQSQHDQPPRPLRPHPARSPTAAAGSLRNGARTGGSGLPW